ncbi:MAG: DNA alkylation repair protein [Bacteroidia bacterium]
MTVDEVMAQLKEMGSAQTLKTFANHGAPVDSMYGVKVGDMKTIVKKVKKNNELSLALFRTGNADAMYLAGLIADEKKITKSDLQEWAKNATWHMISEYTVAWIAAESPHGWELGLEWIDAPDEKSQTAGWSTLSNWVSLRNDDELDFAKLNELLDRVENTIHQSLNRTRYTMNGFLIAVGSYVPLLTDKSLAIAKKIGKVSVEMGGTACKVPAVSEYIMKMMDKGTIGKKKKEARC